MQIFKWQGFTLKRHLGTEKEHVYFTYEGPELPGNVQQVLGLYTVFK